MNAIGRVMMMKKINSMRDMFEYLDSINDAADMRYDDCKCHSFLNKNGYKSILDVVLSLDEVPKRVVDIGSNMNQYAYLFNNAGIDYIGIDLWNADRHMKPYENEHTKFIGAKYEDISDFFKDDVIISHLCVGYLVKFEDVKAKHLITNELENHEFVGKLRW